MSVRKWAVIHALMNWELRRIMVRWKVKEVRLGAGATALWSIVTTVTSNGSVNGMHDSTMPLSGMMEMLNMRGLTPGLAV